MTAWKYSWLRTVPRVIIILLCAISETKEVDQQKKTLEAKPATLSKLHNIVTNKTKQYYFLLSSVTTADTDKN